MKSYKVKQKDSRGIRVKPEVYSPRHNILEDRPSQAEESSSYTTRFTDFYIIKVFKVQLIKTKKG